MTQNGEHQLHMTLLPNPSVTILIDGLICTAYDEDKRLYQAGIHIDAEEHHLVVEVTADGKQVFPSPELSWDTSHQAIIKNAPFRLYVDSSSSEIQKGPGAELYKPDNPKDPWSYANIFSFEDMYKRSLKLDAGRIAEFNFLDGVCYSARNSGADLVGFKQGGDPGEAEFLGRIKVSRMGAIDIPSIRDGEQKWIVLANKSEEVFRFQLQPERHYEIKLMNVPSGHRVGSDPRRHFLKFYELFTLKTEEMVYLIQPDHEPSSPGDHPDFPPCTQTRRTATCGLACGS